ncbi:4Fe-4S cluster-binding domain-containing protein [Poseidonibacter lekithochrous]|uniref:4Fe-4S cluster-binding domain-containing protein n=1 Tax=Poseidonibacter lekithochrous TaxID=1904463 RepID=UPI00196AADD8|nr:4Fe-4S cluster-binding domain-containing protein [Poseidonibacter lekithochrous]
MTNPFHFPRNIRKMILNNVKVKREIQFQGKGFICSLINSRCHIGCNHCMFSSNMDEKKNNQNTMTTKRLDKLMKLVKDSNTGYLLISGGGEGFLELPLMYQIVEKSNADLTWMVTSAFWAKEKEKAIIILNNLYTFYLKGNRRLNFKRKICIRVSFDSYHVQKLSKNSNTPLDYIINIIRIFESTYSTQGGFFLQLHAMEEEYFLVEQLKDKISAIQVKNTSSIHNNEKATESVIKLQLPSGYNFEITFAKLLLSDLTVDIRNKKLLDKRIDLWEKDALINEEGFPSCHVNKDGLIGTDMLIIYNGRVSGGWQSELSDVTINIDKDDYSQIMDKTLSDVAVLSTIEYGLKYRFDIINEICSKAIIRAKAVNIRDYTSLILFEEDIVKAYYSIRVVQDFINKGRIKEKDIESYPSELKEIINMTKEELISLYKSSEYDIIQQFEEKEKGFKIFLEEIRIFSKTKNSIVFIQNLLEKIGDDLFYFDKWRILLKRISCDWYDITSIKDIDSFILKDVELLIDTKILKGRRVYDGLRGGDL